MKPMYLAKDGQVLFRGHPLGMARAERILDLHRRSAVRAEAEGLDGLAAAAQALAEELKRAIEAAAFGPRPKLCGGARPTARRRRPSEID